jgi:nitroimidazol reductase NimA-like FMN-containing flavoprotein (pyridoxamine 5'-phosphate oxidase superfamily)
VTTEMLELSRDECLRLLAEHRFGRLAVNLGGGPPLIRPVNYIFDEHLQSVAFRTAAGSKFYALVHETEAVFEVDGIDESARTGWSVLLQGIAQEITQPAEIRRLEALGLETWAPGYKSHWMRIRAWTISGRRIAVAT